MFDCDILDVTVQNVYIASSFSEFCVAYLRELLGKQFFLNNFYVNYAIAIKFSASIWVMIQLSVCQKLTVLNTNYAQNSVFFDLRRQKWA